MYEEQISMLLICSKQVAISKFKIYCHILLKWTETSIFPIIFKGILGEQSKQKYLYTIIGQQM
jgi:hypothetical protein